MIIIEFTGLPGVGKTTACDELEQNLRNDGFRVSNFQKMLPGKSVLQKVTRRLYAYRAIYSWRNRKLYKVLQALDLNDSKELDFWKKRILIMNYRIMTEASHYDFIVLDEGVITFITSLYHNVWMDQKESAQKIWDTICDVYKKNTLRIQVDAPIETVIDRLLSRNKPGDRFICENRVKMKELLELKGHNIELVSGISQLPYKRICNEKKDFCWIGKVKKSLGAYKKG